jgi:hypothetical protein
LAELIDIPAEDLCAPFALDPHTLLVARLGAAMLYPDDVSGDGAGARWLIAAELEHAERKIAAMDSVSLPGATVARMLRLACQTGATGPLNQRREYIDGVKAGWMTSEMIGQYTGKATRASFQRIKAQAAVMLRKQSVSTLDHSLWPKYRRVAHLWAAHISFCPTATDEGEIRITAFPCHAAGVFEFIECALRIRRTGEDLRFHQSTENLLRQSEPCPIAEILDQKNDCCKTDCNGQPEFDEAGCRQESQRTKDAKNAS